MKLDFATFGPCHELRWDRLKQRIALWRRVARSRRELMNLSDRALSDIGLQDHTRVGRTTGTAHRKSTWLT
jgi:hypothetical protein